MSDISVVSVVARSRHKPLSTLGERAPSSRERPAIGSARAPLWQHFSPGQLLELSGSAPGKLSTAARLITHAQAEGEPVAWVAVRDEPSFYPPDFALAGIDLAALIVVRVPPERGAHALLRAGELLLRSGAFGLLAIDFGVLPLPRGELAWQARLSGLARMHEARVALLTTTLRAQPSLGPLVGLRVEPTLHHEGRRAVLTPEVLKSKLGAAIAVSPDVRTLPLGAVACAVSEPRRAAPPAPPAPVGSGAG